MYVSWILSAKFCIIEKKVFNNICRLILFIVVLFDKKIKKRISLCVKIVGMKRPVVINIASLLLNYIKKEMNSCILILF